MWYANVLAGVGVLALGIVTAALAWVTLPYSGEFGPGPGFLPFWLGIVLIVCAVPVIVADLRATDRRGRLFRPETVKCVQVLGLVVGVFLLLPIVGFSIGLALITGAGMRLMGKHRWWACGLTVVGTAVCIHYVFGQWLSIPIPKGFIGW